MNIVPEASVFIQWLDAPGNSVLLTGSGTNAVIRREADDVKALLLGAAISDSTMTTCSMHLQCITNSPTSAQITTLLVYHLLAYLPDVEQ